MLIIVIQLIGLFLVALFGVNTIVRCVAKIGSIHAWHLILFSLGLVGFISGFLLS